MVGDDCVDRAVGRKHQHVRRCPAVRDGRERVEGRAVAPVQILQHEEQRRRRAHRVDPARELAHHALAGGAEESLAQRRFLVGGEQRRQLREPRRRVHAEAVDGRVARRSGREPLQRLEQRPVRLVDADHLAALGARDHQIGVAVGLREKRVDECRLADAGVTGEEADGALAPFGGGEPRRERRELGVASDDDRRTRRRR